MEDLSEYSLVFVNPVGQNSNGLYEYEFFFSNTPDTVWGEDWNISSPSACKNILPDQEESEYIIKRLETETQLFCAQENSCFSMQDCIDGCIALCFVNLEGLEVYPEPYRLVLHFGEVYGDVIEKLNGLNMDFKASDE